MIPKAQNLKEKLSARGHFAMNCCTSGSACNTCPTEILTQNRQELLHVSEKTVSSRNVEVRFEQALGPRGGRRPVTSEKSLGLPRGQGRADQTP